MSCPQAPPPRPHLLNPVSSQRSHRTLPLPHPSPFPPLALAGAEWEAAEDAKKALGGVVGDASARAAAAAGACAPAQKKMPGGGCGKAGETIAKGGSDKKMGEGGGQGNQGAKQDGGLGEVRGVAELSCTRHRGRGAAHWLAFTRFQGLTMLASFHFLRCIFVAGQRHQRAVSSAGSSSREDARQGERHSSAPGPFAALHAAASLDSCVARALALCGSEDSPPRARQMPCGRVSLP